MWIFGIAGIGILVVILIKCSIDGKKQADAERRRKNTPCLFTEDISHEQFESIVRDSCKDIKRLRNISIDGPIVYGTVLTQSGISEWHFTIDFNDYGYITGKFWIRTENHDSSIPNRIAENCSSAINAILRERVR